MMKILRFKKGHFFRKEGLNNVTKAAYIHIPFVRIFVITAILIKSLLKDKPVDEYIELLIKEMELTGQKI